KERTRKAAELFRLGVAYRIFITDEDARAGWSRNDQRHATFLELEQHELIANGVPPDAITILPGKVTGTDSEAKATAAAIDAQPLKTLLIVTSAYHTRRALRTFEKVMSGKKVTVGIEHASVGDGSPAAGFWWLTVRCWPM